MKDVKKRIEELLKEKEDLLGKYNSLVKESQVILLRINQIDGIVEELNKLTINEQNTTTPENNIKV